MKILKIIYLISSIDKGGAETHLAILAEQVKKKNHKVLVIYFKGNGYWRKYLKKRGIQVLKININNIFSFFFNFFKLKNIVQKFSPDILHCNLSLAEIYGYLIKKFTKLNFRYIITKHLDSYYFEASKGKKTLFKGLFLEKLILKEAYKVIFISKAVKKYFSSEIKLGKQQSCVIYYGLYKKFYKKYSVRDVIKLKKKLKITKKDLIIGCVARHVKQKSLDFLIRSFYVSSIKNKNLKLVIVGTGPLTKELKKIAKSLNLENKIIWINYFEDILKIISIFDICILTSQYEGLGLFLLESLLLKKPIIATSSGAIPEVVTNNMNGYLLKTNDLHHLNKYIEKFKYKHARTKFGNNGYNFFLKKFNLKKMTKSFLNIYEK